METQGASCVHDTGVVYGKDAYFYECDDCSGFEIYQNHFLSSH